MASKYGVRLFKLSYAWFLSINYSDIACLQVGLSHLIPLELIAKGVIGIAAMILMIPVNGYIAGVMKNLQKDQMKNKDSRTRLMTEILNNMKSIKLFSWGSAFMGKLNHVRNDKELATLKKIGTAQSIASFTWSTTPFIVSCKYPPTSTEKNFLTQNRHDFHCIRSDPRSSTYD